MTGHGGWPLNAFLTPEQAPFYRRHLLPARAPPRSAELAHGAGRGRRRLGAAPRGDPHAGRPDRRVARRDRAASSRPTSRSAPRCSTPRSRLARARLRPRATAAGAAHRSSRRRSVIELLLAPAASARWRWRRSGDGPRRHLRPGRRRLLPLRGRCDLDRAALREDALRQRAAGARLPARLAGDAASSASPRVLRDARLGAAGDARTGGRLLRRARRRLRGRRGQVLRVELWPSSARSLGERAERRSPTSAPPSSGNFERGRNVLEGRGPEPERAARDPPPRCSRRGQRASARASTTSG